MEKSAEYILKTHITLFIFLSTTQLFGCLGCANSNVFIVGL
jgi:hypothetical protein